MNLDISTILFSSLLIGVALVLFSWSLALSSGAARWRRDWAWGNTSLFVGVGLLLTQGSWSPWVSVILANGLVILGYHLLETGLRRFANRPLAPWMAWSIVAVFVAVFVPFALIWDLFPLRVAAYTILVAGVWLRILLLLPRLPEFDRHPVLLRSFWVLCSLILVSQAFRAVATLSFGGTALLRPSEALGFMLLVSVVVITAWSLGFVTLDVLRRQHELEVALETRERMLRLIAHDLRGPLGGQVGLLGLMLENGQCRDENGDQELLGLVAVSAQNSFDLLENLLDWGQNQGDALKLQPEAVSPRVLLTQAAEPYDASIRTKAITLTLEAADEPALRVDRRTISTILRNLISNAVKFTPRGGSIRLSYAIRDARPEFVVQNTGPTLRPEQLARLNGDSAVPSTLGTDSEHGSGLGLTLCRDFARLNRASLVFAATAEGTTVTLTLPVAPGNGT